MPGVLGISDNETKRRSVLGISGTSTPTAPLTLSPQSEWFTPETLAQNPTEPFAVTTPPSDSGIFDELMYRANNFQQDIRSMFTPTNIFSAAGTILGATANTAQDILHRWNLGAEREPYQGLPSDNPQTLLDIMWAAAYAAPTLPEVGMAMLQPYTRDILNADRPASADIEQFGRNVSSYWREHPGFALMDVLVVADVLGGAASAGLRSVGGGLRVLGENAEIARLAATGGRMEEIAAGGARPVLRVGNRLINRDYSPNLIRQGTERLFDATLGKNPRVIGAQQAVQPFLPGDLWNRLAATYGRSASQLITDATLRFWFGQSEGLTVADLSTFSRELRGLKPEDYPAWRQYHLNLSQWTEANAGEIQRVIRNKAFTSLDGTVTPLTDSQLRAFETATRTTQAWSNILTGHRKIFRLSSGRYQRWIENETLGPNTEAILRNRTLLPAETAGLSQTIGTGEFITGTMARDMRLPVIGELEGRLGLEQERAARLAANLNWEAKYNSPAPEQPIRVIEPKRPLGSPLPVFERPTGGWQDLRTWQAEQRRLSGGNAEIPIYPEGIRPEVLDFELPGNPNQARRAGLAEFDDMILEQPEVVNFRERIFEELGWKPNNYRRYQVDDATLDLYDRNMQPIRENIMTLTDEIDRLRNIDPGAPLLVPIERRVIPGAPEAYDPTMYPPEYPASEFIGAAEPLNTTDIPLKTTSGETWDNMAVRQHLIAPPDPIALREDMILLREHPELYYRVDGEMISPVYYPHQMAENLADNLVREMREWDYTELRRNRPGYLKTNAGRLLRMGVYDQIVEKVITRNIRSVNFTGAINAVITDTERDFDASRYLAESHPDSIVRNLFVQSEDGTYRLKPAPRSSQGIPNPLAREYRQGVAKLWSEGYRVVYFDGFRKLIQGGHLQDLIKQAARDFGIEYDAAEALERGVGRRLLKQLTDQTQEIINSGRPSVLPRSVVDHLNLHFGPQTRFMELVTNSARWWRKFVLPFRLAWQIGNITSNTFTTAIHGNLGGAEFLTRDIIAKARAIRGGTIVEEVFGEHFGYTPPIQKWLMAHGPVGERLVQFNQAVNGVAMYMVDLNQQFDNLAFVTNQLAQARRDFVAGKPLAIQALEEARVLAGKDFAIADIANLQSTAHYFTAAMEDLYRAPMKPGTARVAYLQELETKAAECVYRYSSLAPWQKKYMATIIPFSGWRLFTLGLMFRFPAKYPGRAFILKEMGVWGQDYVDEMYRQVGIDPNTIPDYDRMTGIPVLSDGAGNVVVMRSSAANLYETIGIEQMPSVLLSHPALRAAADIAGLATFPRVRPLSRPPEYGENFHGRSTFDAAGESIFGPYWDLAAHIAVPYKQYETGGLFQQEVYHDPYTGEPVPQSGGREMLRMQTSLTFTNYNGYDQMEKAYYGADSVSTKAENYFNAIAIAAAENVNQDRGYIRSMIGTYIPYAEQSLDQLGIMYDNAPDERELEQIQTAYNTLMRQISRVMMFKAFLDNPEYEDLRIPPNVLHSEDWREPEPPEVTE